jgi:hypothetical protein
MKTIQKGFIAPLILIIIAILVIGGGAYVYTQQKQANPLATENVALPQATSTTPATSQTISMQQTSDSRTADWKTYTNTELNISFRYPSNWRVQEEKYRTPAQEYEGIASTVTGLYLIPTNKQSVDDYIGLLGWQFSCQSFDGQCYEQYAQIHTKSKNPEVIKVFNDLLSQLKIKAR